MLSLIYVTKIKDSIMQETRGGARPNAGRKKTEPTKVVRLPVSVIDQLKNHSPTLGDTLSEVIAVDGQLTIVNRPLYLSKVAAGFPSPADNYIERRLDLNEHLIKHKEATFFVRVNGDSMTGAGIFDNDLLVVDRAINPDVGRIVVASVNGELTVKRLMRNDGKLWLVAENSAYAPIEMKDGMDCVIWGVVTNAVHAL